MNELISMALAAGPAVAQQAPQAPPPSDPLTPLYILVGTAVVGQLIAGIFTFVKWMGSRTVEREDADKKALLAELEKLKALVDKHREEVDDKFEEADEAVKGLDKSFTTMAHDVAQMRETFTTLQHNVGAITSATEGRIDKQGQHYREEVAKLMASLDKKMEELEYRLRADATRAMRDAQSLPRKKR